MAKDQLFLHPTSPSVTFTIFHLQTDNTHRPRRCDTSYPFSLGGRYSLPYDGMAAALAFLGMDDGQPWPTGGPHGLARLESQNEHKHADTF
jgi:hypothetical protein